MGAVCCVAREGTTSEGAYGEISRRTIQYSPSWGLRWDNRGRVAGEETPVSVIVENVRQSNRIENKYLPHFEPLPEVKISEGNSESNQHKSTLIREDVGTQSNADIPETPKAQRFAMEVEETMKNAAIFDRTNPEIEPNNPESAISTQNKTRSFENEILGSHCHSVAKSDSRKFDSHSKELKTCVACSKYLLEKSSFSSQKIVPNNELPVVAILVCGHAYHADCLEHLTPEFSKYDPSCPVCAFGEQQAMNMFEKSLKEEMNMKRKKRRSRIGNSDIIQLSNGSNPMLESSPSLRSSFSRPFLKRHFSFGYKASSSLSETPQLPVRNRTLPWSKSSK